MFIVCFAGIFGIIMAYKAKKMNARVLFYCGLMAIFVGLIWIGTFVDLWLMFFQIGHIPDRHIYCIMEYMWAFPAFVYAMIIGAELMTPDKKKLILVISIILGIFYELFLFLGAREAFKTPEPPAGELYSSSFVLLHPVFLFIAVFIGTIFVFLVIGSLRMGLKSSGELRTKYFLLALGFFLFIMVVFIDSFFDEPILPDLIMICVAFLIYFALRPKA